MSTPKDYKDNFFEYHLQGALSSAEAIIPIVRKYINPISVMDVGCGIGAWLSVWKKNGVNIISGIDGEYVDTSKLLIKKDEFRALNLEKDFTSDKKYDIITCLEVAEHISASSSEKFIESLCTLGNLILFSAAIPAQQGTMHINEQYPEYWVSLFHKRGFVPVDCLRRRIWDNKNILWWYRQNILFFVRESALENYPKLKEIVASCDGKVLSLVHPEMLKEKIQTNKYYETILNSNKATLKHFINNLFRKKNG